MWKRAIRLSALINVYVVVVYICLLSVHAEITNEKALIMAGMWDQLYGEHHHELAWEYLTMSELISMVWTSVKHIQKVNAGSETSMSSNSNSNSKQLVYVIYIIFQYLSPTFLCIVAVS